MPDDDRDLVRFMNSMVDDDGRAVVAGPDIVDPVSGMLRSDVIPRLRALLRSGEVDARSWFARLVPTLATFSRKYIRDATSGDPTGTIASEQLDWHMLGCELVTALADLARGQGELAVQIVERRGEHDSLLVDTALAILSGQDDESPEGYVRIKHTLVTQGCANREGKAIAHLAPYVPGEMDRLLEALELGTDQTLQEFAIDVLEEHLGQARASWCDTPRYTRHRCDVRAEHAMPRLARLVTDRKVPGRTRSRAMSAMVTFAAAGDASKERGVVEILTGLASDGDLRLDLYDALGKLRRHPALTIPVLLNGLWDDDEDDRYFDEYPTEWALSGLNQYRAPAEVQDLLAEDVRARMRLWEQGEDSRFADEYFDMLALLATRPGPVLDALTALETAAAAHAATMPRKPGSCEPEALDGQRALSRAIRRIREMAERI